MIPVSPPPKPIGNILFILGHGFIYVSTQNKQKPPDKPEVFV